MLLADLPDELFRRIIDEVVSVMDEWDEMSNPPLVTICIAALINNRWQAEVEAACKSALSRTTLTYVPLDEDLSLPTLA